MKKLIFLFLALISARLSAQTPPKDIPDMPANARVFAFVENAPEFPGGDAALIKFLQEHIVYPKKAYRKNIQGKVMIRFIVDELGRVQDVTVARSVDPQLDAEAVRVVSILPNFKPGYQQGKPVKVYFNLPINFKIPQ